MGMVLEVQDICNILHDLKGKLRLQRSHSIVLVLQKNTEVIMSAIDKGVRRIHGFEYCLCIFFGGINYFFWRRVYYGHDYDLVEISWCPYCYIYFMGIGKVRFLKRPSWKGAKTWKHLRNTLILKALLHIFYKNISYRLWGFLQGKWFKYSVEYWRFCQSGIHRGRNWKFGETWRESTFLIDNFSIRKRRSGSF